MYKNMFPNGFAAMLAICSDLDETLNADSYFELMEFLNTDKTTKMGKGVNLEVGNTMYFHMDEGAFSYWNCNSNDRLKIIKCIQSGHIDCLHSYGDLAFTRKQAQECIKELRKNNCFLNVWIDHARAASNLGQDIMNGYGAIKNGPIYHLDLIYEYGIKFIWQGRVSSIIGQNCPVDYSGIYNSNYPIKSCNTIAKGIIKQLMSSFVNHKYRMHHGNQLTRRFRFPNTKYEFVEFIRCNPHWGGVSVGDRGDKIYQVLTKKYLDKLVERKGFSILYTHLGKVDNANGILPSKSIEAFHLLKEYYESKKILVTTTKRLLEYEQLIKQGKSVTNWNKLIMPYI